MNDAFQHLAGFGALKAWLAEHLLLFQESSSLAPRAIVLTGLPGTGKHSVAKAVAATLGRSIAPFAANSPTDAAGVLLIDDLEQEHLPLIRRVADPEEKMPFIIALTERPWELPAGLFRADAIDAVWHLDLPDVTERAEIWDLAARRHGNTNPGFDQVILARASHEFTPAEIHTAYARAARASRPHAPTERHLFDSMLGLQPLVDALKEDLLRLTYWTRRCATPARGG